METGAITAAIGSLAVSATTVVGGVVAWRQAKATGEKSEQDARDALIASLQEQSKIQHAQHLEELQSLEARLDKLQAVLEAERTHSREQDRSLQNLEHTVGVWLIWYQRLTLLWNSMRAKPTPPPPPGKESLRE